MFILDGISSKSKVIHYLETRIENLQAGRLTHFINVSTEVPISSMPLCEIFGNMRCNAPRRNTNI